MQRARNQSGKTRESRLIPEKRPRLQGLPTFDKCWNKHQDITIYMYLYALIRTLSYFDASISHLFLSSLGNHSSFSQPQLFIPPHRRRRRRCARHLEPGKMHIRDHPLTTFSKIINFKNILYKFSLTLPCSCAGCCTGNGGTLSNSQVHGLTWLCLAAA